MCQYSSMVEPRFCNPMMWVRYLLLAPVPPRGFHLPASRGRANLEVRSWESPAEFISRSLLGEYETLLALLDRRTEAD